MIGIVGWVVIFGVLFAWQGLSLVSSTDSWPSLSEMLRRATHNPVGRWLLFGLWLWLGWHLFVRGWQYFLRT